MAFFQPRRGRAQAAGGTAPEVTGPPEREHGPWDVSERPELGDRVDLGALRFSVPEGYAVQRPSTAVDGQVPVVLVRGPEGALLLRVFAAPRDRGVWDQLRADVIREARDSGGQAEEVDGPFGREVRCQMPVEAPDGRTLVQPNRVVGYDGPRWTVRGTLLGAVAAEPRDDGDLMGVFRDLVVVRGPEARRAAEPLLLTLPVSVPQQDS
ncbi:MAG: DUF3710 domain-containing protein [Aeromicrobium sp.]|uniref:DUF3710 domain-containing protein n=1 Tax=Aeromicrobium sp. TaxID=1871063 RepID=UPI0039E436EA